MKITTRITVLLITLLSINTSFAQNMKSPVRFKLKNGLTIIVAENTGMRKIYSRLTIENQNNDTQTVLAQILQNFLNSKAEKFNELMAQNNQPNIKVTMSLNEANTATNIAGFELAFNYVSYVFLNPDVTKQAFVEMKDLYAGNKEELNKITVNDLHDYYQKNFKPSAAFITIAGDITPSDAKEIASKAFGNWNVLVSL